MTKIAVLGSGIVGETLADGFLKLGHEVMRGTREVAKLSSWKDRAGKNASAGSFADAARFGDVAVLAVKGSGAESAVTLCEGGLVGKTVLDTTNPIAAAPPESGVLHFFTTLDDSLMERLQRREPGAHFVKAFSSVGSPSMVQPNFGGVKPTMFICGDDASAKGEAKGLIEALGWEVEDMGAAVAARAIEPLCMLWCIPGMLHGSWTHAFKLLKR